MVRRCCEMLPRCYREDETLSGLFGVTQGRMGAAPIEVKVKIFYLICNTATLRGVDFIQDFAGGNGITVIHRMRSQTPTWLVGL